MTLWLFPPVSPDVLDNVQLFPPETEISSESLPEKRRDVMLIISISWNNSPNPTYNRHYFVDTY